MGVDLDATKIDLARGDAEQAEVANVEFRVADLAGGLGEAEYDVVYARFVLTHLRRPGRRRRDDAWPRCEPGGRLVVEDIDFRGSFCDPEHRVFRAVRGDLRGDGPPPTVATRTSAPARRSCCSTPASSGCSPPRRSPRRLDGEVKLLPPLTLENIKATAVRHGVADAAEIDAARRRSVRHRPRPAIIVGNPRILQAWGS